MTAAIRWAGTFTVTWRPLLTFNGRRPALLEWLAANVDVAAFTEDDEYIGIAIGSIANRLVVDRDSLQIQLLNERVEPSELEAAWSGIFEVLRPTDMAPGTYKGAWSVPLEDHDYSETCSRLAERATIGVEGFGTPYDCSILTDMWTDHGHAKVEFGIVTSPELRNRLLNPRTGQMAVSPDPRPPAIDPGFTSAEVSLFVDVRSHTHEPTTFDSSTQVFARLADVESETSALVEAISRGL